jgi:hypothetical protein
MPYEPFFERFGALALNETRSITIQGEPLLPDDEYGFLEAYCNDENCDCRRVMFNVVSRNSTKILAVIAYGWENKEFYARWFTKNEPSIIHELQGPILNPASEQSALAPALLKLVRDTLLQDPAYIERLKRHYWMFKETVDPQHFKGLGNSKKQNTSEKPGRKPIARVHCDSVRNDAESYSISSGMSPRLTT